MNNDRPGFMRAAIILVALALLFGYAVLSYGGVPSRNWTICLMGVGLLGIVVYASSWSGRRAPPMPRPVSIPLLLLPIYLMLQMVPLPVPLLARLSPARAELLRGLEPILGGSNSAALSVMPTATFDVLLRILAYLVVLLLVREALWGVAAERSWAGAIPIVVIGGLEAVLGLLQYAVDPTSALAKGTYFNRNHFSGLLEMCLPFAAIYALVLFRRFRSARSGRVWRALAFGAATAGAIAMLLAIVCSLSRTGFLAVTFSLVVLAILLLRPGAFYSRTAVAITVVVVLLLFFVLPSNRLLDRYNELFSGNGPSGTRMQVWKAAAGLISAYPVFGCGAGSFESAFNRYNPLPFLTVDFAHNDYLQGLAELGIAGFAIVAAFLFTTVLQAIRATSTEAPPESRALGFACTGALAAILFHSFSDFNLYIPANAMLVAWIAGIVFRQSDPEREVISVGGHAMIDVDPEVIR
jgi:O-antigen ligase